MATRPYDLTAPADDALKNSIPGAIRDVKEHTRAAAGFYSEEQSTPDQTIAIFDGIAYFQEDKVEYDGLDIVDLGTSGGFEVSAMTADYYNKVLFSINSSGTLTATEGTENAVLASVADPGLPSGNLPICIVSVQDDGTGTAGTILSIEQSEIKQVQPAMTAPGTFSSGTAMLFYQATAPTGWTKKSDWASNATIIVGNTFGSGGSDSPTSWETSVGVGAHSLHTHPGGSHTHPGTSHNHIVGIPRTGWGYTTAYNVNGNFGVTTAGSNFPTITPTPRNITSGGGGTANTGSGSETTGNGGPTTHSVTQDTYTPIYQIMIVCIKN